MFKNIVTVFAPFTPNMGEQNQIKGLVTWLARCSRNSKNAKFVTNMELFMQNVTGNSLRCSDYASFSDFEKDMFICFDNYFKNRLIKPRLFVTALTQGEKEQAVYNAEAECRAIKNYYQQKKWGNIMTVIMTAKYGNYEVADLINLPEHQLSTQEFKQVKENLKLADKVFFSLGIVHNLTKTFIRQKYGQKRLQKIAEKYKNNKPNAVFCLGGRALGDDIVFDIDVAQKIWNKALEIKNKNYNVIIVNGPRTPNDVTDFLYKKCVENGEIDFYNSKKIAENDEERQPDKWRIYSGNFEKEFMIQAKKCNNIYPGILGLPNTIAIHTFDSFAACETASSGIPTAICRYVKINAQTRPDCYRLANSLLNGDYAIDLDDFSGENEPINIKLNRLPSVSRLFADKVIEKYLLFKRNE